MDERTARLGEPSGTTKGMRMSDVEHEAVDAVVIGAGFSGVVMVKRLVDLGLSVRAFDAGSSFGGVWNWNRYPGARTDSQHHTFCFSFTEDLLASWRYSDWYPERREVVAYLESVVAKYDLADHFTFATTVRSATYDAAAREWETRTDTGRVLRSRYLLTGVGLLSEPNLPVFDGMADFAGEIHHTSRWPQDADVDFTGKRVAVIGTGSSGIQIVPEIARTAQSLTVFQRTPNYIVPTGNRPVSDQAHTDIVRAYDDIWRMVDANRAWHPYSRTGRLATEASPAERQAVFEACWSRGGHALIQASFDDVMTDRVANEMLCEFVRGKIRSIVEDPETAELLVPDYPYGAKRPPIGDGYLEAFNLPHVSLVDVRKAPIERFTVTGIRTSEADHPFDVVVMATGFDTSTGAFARIDIRGDGGERLVDHWSSGPRTYLGMSVAGFPNFFMVAGPHTPFANLPPGAELMSGWIASCIEHARQVGATAIEPTRRAEAAWTDLVAAKAEVSQAAYQEGVNSWFYNDNIAGKPRAVTIFFGGADVFGELCRDEEQAGYPGFTFDGLPLPDRWESSPRGPAT